MKQIWRDLSFWVYIGNGLLVVYDRNPTQVILSRNAEMEHVSRFNWEVWRAHIQKSLSLSAHQLCLSYNLPADLILSCHTYLFIQQTCIHYVSDWTHGIMELRGQCSPWWVGWWLAILAHILMVSDPKENRGWNCLYVHLSPLLEKLGLVWLGLCFYPVG